MGDLCEYEKRVLLDFYQPQSTMKWGAAKGAAIEHLRCAGYLTEAGLTPAGRTVVENIIRKSGGSNG